MSVLRNGQDLTSCWRVEAMFLLQRKVVSRDCRMHMQNKTHCLTQLMGVKIFQLIVLPTSRAYHVTPSPLPPCKCIALTFPSQVKNRIQSVTSKVCWQQKVWSRREASVPLQGSERSGLEGKVVTQNTTSHRCLSPMSGCIMSNCRISFLYFSFACFQGRDSTSSCSGWIRSSSLFSLLGTEQLFLCSVPCVILSSSLGDSFGIRLPFPELSVSLF